MLLSIACFAQSFTEITTGLPGLSLSASAWGDFDNDGDLDIVITGTTGTDRISRIYRNDGNGVFNDIQAGLTGVESGSVDWGDYNNDGYIDILMTGYTGTTRLSKIFKNNGNGTFIDCGALLAGVSSGRAAWGDYNNDGRPDVIITGSNGSGGITKLYKNSGNDTFTEINIGVQGLSGSSVVWNDYNNDGRLDFAISGSNYIAVRVTTVYRNDGNDVFTDINAGLMGANGGFLSWGDFNSDGYADILLSGFNSTTYPKITKLYRNNSGNGTFTEISTTIPGLMSGSAGWGDCDNDGDLDILLTGDTGTERITRIYRNNGNSTFSDLNSGLFGAKFSSSNWGDFDNDGDLDILLTGINGTVYVSKIYKNGSVKSNTLPSRPQNPSYSVIGSDASLYWEKATDLETAQAGLTYNVYIGTSPGITDIRSAESMLASGYRKITVTGNCGTKNSYEIKGLANGTYYWGVQTVDNALAGSLFTSEQSFTVSGTAELPSVPVATSSSDITHSGFTANWNSSLGAEYYKLDVARDSLFMDFVTGYEDLTVNAFFKAVTNLAAVTDYYYRIRAVNAAGASGNSNVIITTTAELAAPLAITASDVLITSFRANWMSSAGAAGYRLDVSAVNDFSSFLPCLENLNVGNVTSYLVTNLTGNTNYYYRLRAYNTGGGLSPYSNVMNVKTYTSPVPPPPVALDATEIGLNSFKANWSNSIGASGYRIDVSTDSLFATFVSVYNNKDVGNVLSRTVSSIPCGSDYYYRVRAYDNYGYMSLNSNVIKVSTLPLAPPVANPAQNITAGSFTASWSNTTATSYRIDVSTDSLFVSYVTGYQNLSVGAVVTYTISGLTNNTKYYYRIRSEDYFHLKSENSNSISAITLSLVAPVAYAATNVYSTSFRANWSAAGALGYRLDVATDSLFSSFVTNYQNKDVGNTEFASVTGLTTGITYYYRVKGYDGDGNLSSNSNVINVTVTLPPAPIALPATNVTGHTFFANWTSVEGVTRYLYDLSTDSLFGSFVTGYQNKIVDADSLMVSGLTSETYFYYRIRSLVVSDTSAYSNRVAIKTLVGEFSEIASDLTGVYSSATSEGDYDNDGDIDIIMAGNNGSAAVSIIYRNDGNGSFTDINAGLVGVYNSVAEWIDFNNDGLLDILLSGYTGSEAKTIIYENDGNGNFNDTAAGLTGFYSGAADCGDYDNDGDIDILISGTTGTTTYSKLYRNDGGFIFTEVTTAIPAGATSLEWGDYDNDGDLDILRAPATSKASIYRNEGNDLFTLVQTFADPAKTRKAVWVDCNNDGKLDVLISGYRDLYFGGGSCVSVAYFNINGVFEIGTWMYPYYYSNSLMCADYDNDGNTDALFTGYNSRFVTLNRKYEDGIYRDIAVSITPVNIGTGSWFDYDNDNDLDIFLTGSSVTGGIAKIYRNNSAIENTPPSSPSNLSAVVDSSSVTLSWSKATDNETPQDGLSYNFYLGSSSSGTEIVSPMSDTATGKRRVVKRGNAEQNTSWTIDGLSDGTYYWSVQAVDNGYAGSEFAPEQMFFVGSMYPPQNVTIAPLENEVSLSWTSVNGATSYKVFASDDPYGTFTDVSAEGLFSGTSWSQTTGEIKKFYYVVAVSE